MRIFIMVCLLSCPLALIAEAAPAVRPEPYVAPADNQLMTLGTAKKPRFKVQEIAWPAELGQAEVCLWQDDLYAACSITIDDNNLPDHPWWMKISEKHGIKLTFFVITGKVDGANKGYDGTWDDWRAVLAAGHDVQSHSVTHPKTGDTDPDEVTIGEYADAKQAIETNLPGHRCVVLAYPWGKGRPDIAQGYYLAVRGVTGTPSRADQINYLDTTDGSLNGDQVNAILGLPATNIKWLNNPVYKRGWIQPLYHLVARGTTPEEKRANIAKVEAEIEYLVSHRDQIWIDTFANVAKYAQERDSATLSTVNSSAKRIELSLVDLMRDDLFDQPLCLKVRIPSDWTDLVAKQGETALTATIIQHEGGTFALVKAVPDHGNIVLTPK